MDKPTVYYGKVIGFTDVEGQGIRARLADITGHPRLGDTAVVTTSIILSMKYDAGVTKLEGFETLNTIYRKREVTE
jgi:hypothetical protein